MTKKLFNYILQSNLFRLNGKDIDLVRSLSLLCRAIEREEETDWTLGECQDCTLADLIVGAYWSVTQWHGGQYSDTYALLCSLGSIYSPGMEDGPEPDSGEKYVFDAINEYFEKQTA